MFNAKIFKRATSAVNSFVFLAGFTSSKGVMVALKYGSVCTNSRKRKSLLALNDHGCISVRHAQHFEDARHGADGIHVGRCRIFNTHILLRQNTDDLRFLVRVLYQFDSFYRDQL
jgi:hypothetical protein